MHMHIEQDKAAPVARTSTAVVLIAEKFAEDFALSQIL